MKKEEMYYITKLYDVLGDVFKQKGLFDQYIECIPRMRGLDGLRPDGTLDGLYQYRDNEGTKDRYAMLCKIINDNFGAIKKQVSEEQIDALKKYIEPYSGEQ